MWPFAGVSHQAICSFTDRRLENVPRLRMTSAHVEAFSPRGAREEAALLPLRRSPPPLTNPFPLRRSPVAVGHGCYCLALLRSVPAAAYIVLVTALRYHLFIWSVFSPKLLYESMHLLLTAGVCLFFNTMEQSHSSSKS